MRKQRQVQDSGSWRQKQGWGQSRREQESGRSNWSVTAAKRNTGLKLSESPFIADKFNKPPVKLIDLEIRLQSGRLPNDPCKTLQCLSMLAVGLVQGSVKHLLKTSTQLWEHYVCRVYCFSKVDRPGHCWIIAICFQMFMLEF